MAMLVAVVVTAALAPQAPVGRAAVPRATASVATAPSWQLAAAMSSINALERTGGSRPHSLLTGMFDAASGLCSEGVWHNSWLGVSRILVSRQLRLAGDAERADEQVAAAQTLGDSLYRIGFDGTGFRRRSATGFWQSALEAELAIAEAGETPAFYAPSDEHRCISGGAAVIFFSLLAEEGGDDAAAARAAEVGSAFTSEFFDDDACRFRRGGAADHWRAVDQAVGCLACLRLARTGHEPALTRAMAGCAVDSLLRDFGYSLYATEGQPPGTYLGRVAPRNSWHDGLAALALLASGVLGVGGESPKGLVRALVADYRCPQTKAWLHRPKELRDAQSHLPREVAFTGSQALWSAVVRAAEITSERAEAAGGTDLPALRAWHETHAADDGLLPVANLYRDARLWANTEWAAWLLLDKADFSV